MCHRMHFLDLQHLYLFRTAGLMGVSGPSLLIESVNQFIPAKLLLNKPWTGLHFARIQLALHCINMKFLCCMANNILHSRQVLCTCGFYGNNSIVICTTCMK